MKGLIVAGFGFALMCVGYANEAPTVLKKSVRICLECIGVG
tara:strand:- start:392 stop:514 length:123 start_codon:yes stop_codon:yes gene_type:complete